jgi:hypothetical protein
MTAIPSIVLVAWLAMLSMVGAVVLRRPWQKYVALGCAAIEVAVVAFLVVLVST